MTEPVLFVTDLDGTLLNSASEVSEKSAELLSVATRKGSLITVATARTVATVAPLLSKTELNVVPWILTTGATLFSQKKFSFERVSTLKKEHLSPLYTTFVKYSVSPFVYYHQKISPRIEVYHHPEMNEAEQNFYQPRSELELKKFNFVENVFDIIANGAERNIEPTLFLGIGKSGDVMELAHELKSYDNLSVSAYCDSYDKETAYIEVFERGVNKANAIKQVTKRMKVKRVIAFGDNINDISMLRYARETEGLAIAVENAIDEVKEIADIVIGSNDTDSVAEFISSFHTS